MYFPKKYSFVSGAQKYFLANEMCREKYGRKYFKHEICNHTLPYSYICYEISYIAGRNKKILLSCLRPGNIHKNSHPGDAPETKPYILWPNSLFVLTQTGQEKLRLKTIIGSLKKNSDIYWRIRKCEFLYG